MYPCWSMNVAPTIWLFAFLAPPNETHSCTIQKLQQTFASQHVGKVVTDVELAMLCTPYASAAKWCHTHGSCLCFCTQTFIASNIPEITANREHPQGTVHPNLPRMQGERRTAGIVSDCSEEQRTAHNCREPRGTVESCEELQ